MSQSRTQTEIRVHLNNLVNRIFFLLFATAGLAVIGLAVLAGPLTQYSADRRTIYVEEKALARAQHLYSQQEALLARGEDPVITERIAVNHYRYASPESAYADRAQLAPAWGDLTLAVKRVETPLAQLPVAPQSLPAEPFIRALADDRPSRDLLVLFGSVLVLTSLMCFTRKPMPQ